MSDSGDAFAATLEDLAGLLGRSPATLRRWSKAGCPCAIRHRTPAGYPVDPVRAWAGTAGLLADPAAPAVPLDETAADADRRYKRARADKEEGAARYRVEAAKLKELERERVEAELRPVDVVAFAVMREWLAGSRWRLRSNLKAWSELTAYKTMNHVAGEVLRRRGPEFCTTPAGPPEQADSGGVWWSDFARVLERRADALFEEWRQSEERGLEAFFEIQKGEP